MRKFTEEVRHITARQNADTKKLVDTFIAVAKTQYNHPDLAGWISQVASHLILSKNLTSLEDLLNGLSVEGIFSVHARRLHPWLTAVIGGNISAELAKTEPDVPAMPKDELVAFLAERKQYFRDTAAMSIAHIKEVLPESNNEFVNFLANSYNYKLY